MPLSVYHFPSMILVFIKKLVQSYFTIQFVLPITSLRIPQHGYHTLMRSVLIIWSLIPAATIYFNDVIPPSSHSPDLVQMDAWLHDHLLNEGYRNSMQCLCDRELTRFYDDVHGYLYKYDSSKDWASTVLREASLFMGWGHENEIVLNSIRVKKYVAWKWGKNKAILERFCYIRPPNS